MKKISWVIASITFLMFAQSCTLFSAAGLSSQGQPVKEVQGELKADDGSEAIVDHSIWDGLLKKHVDKNGLVDYKGFQKDKAMLDEYLTMLSQHEPDDSWSVQELLVYYINTYNAYTVDLILDNYPVKSIKDINGPWTRGIVPIGDTDLSLGGIENGILRKMNEPRIHFAINCASFSCPKLQNEAYTISKIDQQLDKAASEFINSDKNNIDSLKAELSSIFDWYRKDFIINGEVDVIGYINKYSKTKIKPGATISYKNYDWNLNEQ